MNIQEQYFKGVPNYYPSMYLDGYTPQQIMYAVRNKMIQEYKGPVDKSQKTAETHRGPSRIINWEIAKDGILPSA